MDSLSIKNQTQPIKGRDISFKGINCQPIAGDCHSLVSPAVLERDIFVSSKKQANQNPSFVSRLKKAVKNLGF